MTHPMVVAQALVERGLLDSIAAGVGRVRYQVDAFFGYDGSSYLVIGVVVLLAYLLVRRKR